MNSKKNFRAIGLLTLGLLAVLLFVGQANAAPPFEGKFTLPNEVRWGKAVLPAGNYCLRVSYFNTTTMVTIQEADSMKTVAFLPSLIAEDNKNNKGESALLIAGRGGQRVVHSLRLAELGIVLIYDPALARDREIIEAHKTQSVPILAAKK